MNILLSPFMFLIALVFPGKKTRQPLHDLDKKYESAIPFLKDGFGFDNKKPSIKHSLCCSPVATAECHLFQVGQYLTWRKDFPYLFFTCQRAYGVGPFQVLKVVLTGKKMLVTNQVGMKKTLRDRLRWTKNPISKGVTIIDFSPSVQEVMHYILEDPEKGTILIVPPNFLTRAVIKR